MPPAAPSSSTLKPFIVVNVGGIIGAIASLFLVPESTPLWLWGVCVATILIAINLLAWRRKRNPRPADPERNVMLVIGLICALLALLFRLFR
jgi:multisubunit Na+/H+ antiporter MnhB subunit